eukprot:1352076-Amorphochlora_amoeboformis.AAC.1
MSVVGGFTSFRAPNADETKIILGMKKAVAGKLKVDEFKTFEVKGVQTQVVAGINYKYLVP